jgi:tight adherence protein C
MPLLFFSIAFATVAALLWSGYRLFENRADPLASRLEELQAQAVMAQAQLPGRYGGGGLLNTFVYGLSLIPGVSQYLNKTERELKQAGVRSKAALAFFVLGHFLFVGVMLVGMAWLQRGNDFSQKAFGMVAALLLGSLLPNQVLHHMVKRYRQKLRDALPDTVDMLGIVLGTGLSLDQSMTRVAEEMQFIYPELSNEFYTVVMQVRAGQERSLAFQQMVRRTGLEDLKSLASMILQSERFGTSLAQALKVYADALRTRRRLKAEAAVAKAGVKMLFPIVLFILPALFVITLVPGLLSVLRDLKGGIGPP